VSGVSCAREGVGCGEAARRRSDEDASGHDSVAAGSPGLEVSVVRAADCAGCEGARRPSAAGEPRGSARHEQPPRYPSSLQYAPRQPNVIPSAPPMQNLADKERKRAYLRDYRLRNRERLLRMYAEYRKNNPEKVKAAIRAWYASERGKQMRRDYFKTYAKTEPFLRAKKKYAANNREQKSESGRKWREANPGKNCSKSNKRRADKLCRTPLWLSPDDHWMIAEIYDLAQQRSRATGVTFHVDHIVPLSGKTVSGLHVPLNLQVIQAVDNLRKQNRHC
jgi:hypothetical protein